MGITPHPGAEPQRLLLMAAPAKTLVAGIFWKGAYMRHNQPLWCCFALQTVWMKEDTRGHAEAESWLTGHAALFFLFLRDGGQGIKPYPPPPGWALNELEPSSSCASLTETGVKLKGTKSPNILPLGHRV